jgi:LuxR family transcriptional regulator, activator of tox operons
MSLTLPCDPPTSLPEEGAAILSLGQDDFACRLIDFFDRLVGVDLCSAFVVERPGRLRYLFASTKDRVHQQFAERASVRYAQEFWRYDPALADRVAGACNGYISVVQQSRNAIKNAEYRSSCYEDPNVLDRASIFGVAGGTVVLVSVYRRLSAGCFTNDEIRAVQLAAGLIMSLTAKHASLCTALAALHPSIEQLAQQIGRIDAQLSCRERQICAAILAGKSVKDIAREHDLQISTVVTYKKRAYLKLGIETRRDLERLYNEALGSELPHRPAQLRLLRAAADAEA